MSAVLYAALQKLSSGVLHGALHGTFQLRAGLGKRCASPHGLPFSYICTAFSAYCGSYFYICFAQMFRLCAADAPGGVCGCLLRGPARMVRVGARGPVTARCSPQQLTRLVALRSAALGLQAEQSLPRFDQPVLAKMGWA